MAITKLADLTPDPSNANRGTERGDGLLETSIERYGLGRSIVTDRNGVILAGNKTAQKAGELGMEAVEVVHTSGDRLVVVVRDDLEHGSAQATGLALADNRVGQVNLDFDLEALAAVQATYPEEFEAFWLDGELDIQLPDPAPQQPPTLEAEHFVGIHLTRDALEAIAPTLESWDARDDITVNIS